MLAANIAWPFVTTRLDLRVIFSEFLVEIVIPHQDVFEFGVLLLYWQLHANRCQAFYAQKVLVSIHEPLIAVFSLFGTQPWFWSAFGSSTQTIHVNSCSIVWKSWLRFVFEDPGSSLGCLFFFSFLLTVFGSLPQTLPLPPKLYIHVTIIIIVFKCSWESDFPFCYPPPPNPWKE